MILPAATSLALSAVVWKFAFEPNNLVNHTLALFGSTKGGIPWLANVPQAMSGDDLRGHLSCPCRSRR